MSKVFVLETKKRPLDPIHFEAISQELVRFDMQLMANPDIQGQEYQQRIHAKDGYSYAV
jgi:hypothetical protein